ncbi:MAG: DNA repair protein RadC [Firmicutes bacterium]|nr:DNA repair protein RadC [Bacillota bacterium]
MKDLPETERPRERLFKVGPEALTHSELLAVILRTGSGEGSALDLARQLLAIGRVAAGAGRELGYLSEAPIEEICGVKGIGRAKAAQVKAAFELGKRAAAEVGRARTPVRCPSDVGQLFVKEMKHLDREQFRAVLLNTKNQLYADDLVLVGSLNESIVHPREIFKAAIRKSAAAVILVHNHPSGDPSPSPEDVDVTARLVEAGRILGIDVLDHVVVGEGRFVSMRESGAAWR